jgi:hypothetical protein
MDSRSLSAHLRKNNDHLAEKDDILFVQQQLNSDFQLTGVVTLAELLDKLAAGINQLIETDFSRLVMILYRIDVSEATLKKMLQENPGTNACDLLAKLIVERQLQKQKTRQQYKPRHDIPDDEKW